MSRKRFGAGAVLAAVLLAGCAAAGEFVVDNGSFRVEFVDPNDPQLGCRFLRAGWIRSLHPAGSRESIFVTGACSVFILLSAMPVKSIRRWT